MNDEASPREHLTPHDLVSYSRCPYEMEVQRARHASYIHGTAVAARTPIDVRPLAHSPLFSPPTLGLQAFEGPLDLNPDDILVYEDANERGLPVLFPPERVRLDARFTGHQATLIDDALGLSGRPDLVIRRGDGGFVPVEYKSTHMFVGYHAVHGRLFDAIQSIAECALVAASFGSIPSYGWVVYGDAAGSGAHEGWVVVPFGDPERRWLSQALGQIRADNVRPPVPSEGHCGHCEVNREGLCRFAARPYSAEEGLRPLGRELGRG
ncbi:MAG TPA: hypothetical protein VJS68_03425 [Thermoplasmata archaeon]|nr:hypothetical protein [Thermoplasmata archaeon]